MGNVASEARSPIRHLAAAASTPRVAAAHFERRVEILQIPEGETAAFDTILDFGGRRLALTPDGACCIAAAYATLGVAAYDAEGGRSRWHRRDLVHVQHLDVSHDGARVFCGREEASCRVLEVATGADVADWAGVRRVIESPDQAWLLADTYEDVELLDGAGRRVRRLGRETFGLLAAVFTPDALYFSEATGTMRALALPAGTEAWRYIPPEGCHVLTLGYSVAAARVLGLQWSYVAGGPLELLTWDRAGGLPAAVARWPAVQEAVFCFPGDRLLLADGRLYDAVSGDLLTRVPRAGSPASEGP